MSWKNVPSHKPRDLFGAKKHFKFLKIVLEAEMTKTRIDASIKCCNGCTKERIASHFREAETFKMNLVGRGKYMGLGIEPPVSSRRSAYSGRSAQMGPILSSRPVDRRDSIDHRSSRKEILLR